MSTGGTKLPVDLVLYRYIWVIIKRVKKINFFCILYFSYISPTFLPLFISDFILLICSNPSSVKCALLCINKATFLKSSKSFALSPHIGYLSKNGIIFSVRSEYLVTSNLTASLSLYL
jgi:hypothetical protein